MTPITPERKAEIARANGAKSRGPATREGRAVSSMNALRHGLTASQPVLPGESLESFQLLLKDYIEEWEPEGPAEIDLVHRMVVSKWREQRAWTVETAALRSHMPSPAVEEPATPDPAADLTAAFTSYTGNSHFLDCFYRQENAVTRRFDRALDRLLDLQERRHALHPREIHVRWVDERTPHPPPKHRVTEPPSPESIPRLTNQSVTDPSATDPSLTDPSNIDPSLTDPGATDPSVSDRSLTDPPVIDRRLTDPSATIIDPSATDPSNIVPSFTDPSLTDPSVNIRQSPIGPSPIRPSSIRPSPRSCVTDQSVTAHPSPIRPSPIRPLPINPLPSRDRKGVGSSHGLKPSSNIKMVS